MGNPQNLDIKKMLLEHLISSMDSSIVNKLKGFKKPESLDELASGSCNVEGEEENEIEEDETEQEGKGGDPKVIKIRSITTSKETPDDLKEKLKKLFA